MRFALFGLALSLASAGYAQDCPDYAEDPALLVFTGEAAPPGARTQPDKD